VTIKYRNYLIGSNPLRLPLDMGRDKLAPPLLRGGWEGFESVMIYGKIIIKQKALSLRLPQDFQSPRTPLLFS